ncbi:hypothetical protein Leryth_016958 [Lithospermum erythrorhizon]|nr:hypothetical protein Leryth_016958 [Lithospermum erythrorhizon]
MGVLEFSDTFTSSVPAAKLFKAWFVESDTLLPKVAPNQVKSVDLVEGNGGPGAIKQVNFAQGTDPEFKQRLKVTHEIKFVSQHDGGCYQHNSVTKFYTTEGANLSEDELQASKEGALGLIKLVEAHLLAN